MFWDDYDYEASYEIRILARQEWNDWTGGNDYEEDSEEPRRENGDD